MSSPILPRDKAFFLFLCTHGMKKYRDQIINQRDKFLSTDASCRETLVLYMNHSTIPPRILVCSQAVVHRLHGPNIRYFKPSKGDNEMSAEVADATPSTAVWLRIAVPYGVRIITIPFRSEEASSLLGWHRSNLIQAKPTERGLMSS